MALTDEEIELIKQILRQEAALLTAYRDEPLGQRRFHLWQAAYFAQVAANELETLLANAEKEKVG